MTCLYHITAERFFQAFPLELSAYSGYIKYIDCFLGEKRGNFRSPQKFLKFSVVIIAALRQGFAGVDFSIFLELFLRWPLKKL